MLAFSDPIFWAYFLFFFQATFLAFYIPGNLLVRKLELPILPQIIISTILGMVLWAWQGMMFGYLNIRELSYAYVLIAFVFWLKSVYKKRITLPNRKKTLTTKSNWILLTLILIGTIIQVTTIWFTQTPSNQGIYLCCGNASDSLFQTALTKQIIDRFPPYEPGMYGVIVHNYHYWSNLVIAELIRVFHLPLPATQNQYAPTFISLFLGLTLIAFGKIIKARNSLIAWLLFFLYFGGDFVYMVIFTLGKGLNFNMSSLEDGARFLVNPPRAFSIVIFFAGLSLLTLWIKKKDSYTGILTAMILGSLIGFKVYTGLFALTGLAGLGIYFLYKKNFRMLAILLIAPILSLAIYLPVNASSGGLFFTGLWIFDNFIVQKDLGLLQWELAKVNYQEHHSWLRVTQYETTFIEIYLVATFGSKLLGLFQTKKSLAPLPKQLHIFLVSGLIVNLILGLFFQQSTGGSNTFNFLVSVFLIGSIYTALTCTYLTHRFNKKFAVFLIVLIMLVTIPRVTYESVKNLKQIATQQGSLIDKDELNAYQYLRQNTTTNSLILVDTSNLPLSHDSPFMSLFTDRHIYLSGQGILASHGINYAEREKVINNLLTTDNPQITRGIINQNKIDYIVLSAQKILPSEAKACFLSTIFTNQKVRIVKPIIL